MKNFLKMNSQSLLLGFIFYLQIMFIFNEYDIQQSLNLSENSMSTIALLFYFIIFIIISVTVFMMSNKWLNGSKWSLLLTISWIPYVYPINQILSFKVNDANNYGAGLMTLFLIITFPIYIFILSALGIFLNKTNPTALKRDN